LQEQRDFERLSCSRASNTSLIFKAGQSPPRVPTRANCPPRMLQSVFGGFLERVDDFVCRFELMFMLKAWMPQPSNQTQPPSSISAL
jgi:hypothetical protein